MIRLLAEGVLPGTLENTVLGVCLLGLAGFVAITVRWAATNCVMPLVSTHIKTMDAQAACLDKMADALESQAKSCAQHAAEINALRELLAKHVRGDDK